MNAEQLSRIIFFFLLFLIPCNLGKHWPQSWSYVNGILVDYFIPTLYLTDILIFFILLFWFINRITNHKLRQSKTNRPGGKIINYQISNIFSFKFLVAVLSFAFCVLSYSQAKNHSAFLYKLLKITEFTLLSIYIVRYINIKQDIRNIIKALSLSVVFQSLLAIVQWFKQASVFGYWFFGEQPYYLGTLGIKKISFPFTFKLFNLTLTSAGELKIPPLGTFPHPNVLAGFLCLSLLLILYYLHSGRFQNGIKNILLAKTIWLSFILGSVVLLLTFSLPAIFAFGLSLLISYLANSRVRFNKTFLTKFYYSLLFTVYSLLFIWLAFRFNEPISLIRRTQLNQIAIKMWLSSPIFGVGLNNFIPQMETFGTVVANYRFFQPVHNVYLLVLAETGVCGLVVTVFSIKYLVFKGIKNSLPYILYTTYCILFLSFFDHYFFTLQQGMLMATLFLALVLNSTSVKTRSLHC